MVSRPTNGVHCTWETGQNCRSHARPRPLSRSIAITIRHRLPHHLAGDDRQGMWTAADLLGAALDRPVALAHLGLRTASTVIDDALALAATDGALASTDLREATDLEATLAKSVTSPTAAAALGLLWSARAAEQLPEHGARIYAWLIRTGRLPAQPLHHSSAAQALYLAGRADELRELWPSLECLPRPARNDLEVDLAHPGLTGPESFSASSQQSTDVDVDEDVHARWVRLLSAPFVEHGLTPLIVSADGPEPHLFDRLRSTAAAHSTGGPLVTVIVPCWRPDEALLTSVLSITSQTYADLEILLVDDASGPGYDELFEQVAGSDPRIQLLRLEHNGGSYLARRAALQVARGRLVTTQDADDWSHPQRIERQVAALQEHPEAPASRSLAIRARDDLTHQWFGYRAVRDNASSLLVRREAMAVAGTFWPIRKSADSEYAERLARLVGPIADTGSPLAITRLRGGSLSRGDFTYQWSHPDRIAFRGIYRAWHRSLSPRPEGTVDPPTAPVAPPVDLELPEAPAAFARGLTGTHVIPAHLHVAILGDFSTPPSDPRHQATVHLLADLAGPAASIGLWHAETPSALDLKRPEMHDEWYDRVVLEPDLHVLTRTSPTAVTALLVVDPAILLTAAAQPTTVRADRVEVALSSRETLPGEAGLPLDLLSVSDACRQWWGRHPHWVVLGDQVAIEGLREELPLLRLETSVVGTT